MTDITTEADIEGAERLLGLAYSARERAQVLDNLDGQRDLAIDRRALTLENSTPTATRFDPRLPGFAMPHGADTLSLSDITWCVLQNVHNSIVTVDKDLNVIPMLAESFSQSDDGLTYTFKLRAGVKFHNGADMTSEDVKYSFARRTNALC